MALLSNVLFYRVWPDVPGTPDTAMILAPVAKSYGELTDLARILTQGRPPVIEPCFRTPEEKKNYITQVGNKIRMSND